MLLYIRDKQFLLSDIPPPYFCQLLSKNPLRFVQYVRHSSNMSRIKEEFDLMNNHLYRLWYMRKKVPSIKDLEKEQSSLRMLRCKGSLTYKVYIDLYYSMMLSVIRNSNYA